jgi:hypothetical protein
VGGDSKKQADKDENEWAAVISRCRDVVQRWGGLSHMSD